MHFENLFKIGDSEDYAKYLMAIHIILQMILR